MTITRPPMGWNSWNTFAENIDEKLIMETGKFLKRYYRKTTAYRSFLPISSMRSMPKQYLEGCAVSTKVG